MRAHGEGGHIVNTSSMAGVLPIPGAAIYITAKAAVIGLSEALRSELAGEGIGVSAFCPGPVQTNIREGGRMRPEQYADSGYTELERDLEERPNSPLWMDPVECGERVLAGIRDDDLYIFTHREFREGAEERFQAMLASFPDEPRNEERAKEIDFLLSNPIFRDVLERRTSRVDDPCTVSLADRLTPIGSGGIVAADEHHAKPNGSRAERRCASRDNRHEDAHARSVPEARRRSQTMRPVGLLSVARGRRGLALAVTFGACLAVSAVAALAATSALPPPQVLNYQAYAGGKGKADPKLSPVTIGFINGQGGPPNFNFPQATQVIEAAVRMVERRARRRPRPSDQAAARASSPQAEEEGVRCGQQMANDKNVKAILFGIVIVGNQSIYATIKGTKPIISGVTANPADPTAKNAYFLNGSQTSVLGAVRHVHEARSCRK